MITLIRALSLTSNKIDIRSLVFFTFNCKDYDMIYLDKIKALALYTEQSFINSSSFIIHRAI